MVDRNELFFWVGEKGGPAKVFTAVLLSSLWFLVFFLLWHFGYLSNWKSFLILFRHPLGWLAFMGFFLSPAANVLVVGYFSKYARTLMGSDPPALPSWAEPATVAGVGAKMFVLGLLAFLPTIFSFGVALFSFSRVAQGDEFAYLAHFWFAILAGLVGMLLAFFSWIFLPICVLRYLESDEWAWALMPREIFSDFASLGKPYWRAHLLLTAFLLGGETLLLIGSILLALSPLGSLFAGALFVLFSCVVWCVLALWAIRQYVTGYKELHYDYL